MFETDLHAHTHFSKCGLHSIIEILTQAKSKGLKAQAITDHGPFLGRKINSTFFDRLENPVKGITLLKGMECNVTDEDGGIDIIDRYMPWYDVVLLGFHNFKERDREPAYYSEIMKKAITRNPCVDIIVHPDAPHFTMDFRMIAEAAAEAGTAVELNNAKLKNGRSDRAQGIKLIESCLEAGCDVAANSDAHALNEVGTHSMVEELIDYTGFPRERIINRTLSSTMDWIKKRKENRIERYQLS